MKLYTIYDKLAGEYGPVFEAKNDLVAARSFAHALKGAPAIDYDLFQVGYRVDLSAEPDAQMLIHGVEPRLIPVDIVMSTDKKYGLVEVKNNEER